MPRFRPSPSLPDHPDPSSLDHVRQLLADAVAPRHFFTGKMTVLEWEHLPREEVSWEVFQGRLLDAAHTSRRQTFEAWNIFLKENDQRSAEALLSVKLDTAAGQVHIVRAIHSYAWEGYHAGDNVYLSRETRKWVRELVGTLPLDQFDSMEELRDEVICQLFHAVIGTSRLPLTSIEAPLPAYSLGELGYFYRREGEAGPIRSYQGLIDQLLHRDLSWLEEAKLLETLLRAVPFDDLAPAAERFVDRWRALGQEQGEIPPLFRTLFNEVSLSPYTDFVDKTLAFLHILGEQGHVSTVEVVDLLGHILRQSGRHLTAYDLVTFHHRGANYPDALLLDTLLKAYLNHIDKRPGLFLDAPGEAEPLRKVKRLRRRALRQGWLLRRRYEGHPVPEAPTSQGENQRVLPPPYRHLSEEQILQPHRRTKRLYEGDALPDRLGEQGRAALRQSILDLHHPHELQELGMALFLDRPLGAAKGPVEPDQTPLLSYEAFSRSVVLSRLDFLAEKVRLIEPSEYDALRHGLRTSLTVQGISVETIESTARPGTVSLADARRTADDFILLRTTARAASDFLALFDFQPLAERFSLGWLNSKHPVLIVGGLAGKGSAEVVLQIHDADLRKRLELVVDLTGGYASRGGIEYPANGLRVGRVWVYEEGFREYDLESERIMFRPRI